MTLRIIAGKFKGRILKTVKHRRTRPTQGVLRQAVFNICQHEIEGARFLDLFAGSGAMGLEALSRGAAHATLVEQNKEAIACIRANIEALHIESQAHLIPENASSAVKTLTKQKVQFDLAYLDPPYDLPFDPAPLLSLISLGGVLFFEKRYHPQQEAKEFPGFTLKAAKRFGGASLTIFIRTH